MTSFAIQTLESDLHRLDLRFAALRMHQPRVIERLARSIAQNGQLVPVVAVAEQNNQLGTDRWLSAYRSPAPPVAGYR
jgi:ParB-like chromosome segregation protein Spo0J